MKISDTIFNIFFPKRCLFCDSVIGFLKECDRCDHDGQRLPSRLLYKNSDFVKYLDGVAALYQYEGCIRNCIGRVKFAGDEDSGKRLSMMFAQRYPAHLFERVDCIITVPDFKVKQYSLAQNMLSELLMTIKIESPKVIIKNRATKKQHDLKQSERQQNLKGAFSCIDKNLVADKSFLIVDDVITTGATVNEIAKLLKENGAKAVFAYAFASTP